MDPLRNVTVFINLLIVYDIWIYIVDMQKEASDNKELQVYYSSFDCTKG